MSRDIILSSSLHIRSWPRPALASYSVWMIVLTHLALWIFLLPNMPPDTGSTTLDSRMYRHTYGTRWNFSFTRTNHIGQHGSGCTTSTDLGTSTRHTIHWYTTPLPCTTPHSADSMTLSNISSANIPSM